MPIPRCTPRNKYQTMLFTGGPIDVTNFCYKKDECKQAIYDVIYQHYGVNLAACVVALERSKEGYRHFHAAVHLVKRMRFEGPAVKLKAHLATMEKEERQPNCGVYHWPQSVKDPWIAAKNYLVAPVKDKSIDADSLDVEEVDWEQEWTKNKWNWVIALDSEGPLGRMDIHSLVDHYKTCRKAFKSKGSGSAK